MAKGDPSRVQNAVDYRGGTAWNNLNNQQRETGDRTNNIFMPNYLRATGQWNQQSPPVNRLAMPSNPATSGMFVGLNPQDSFNLAVKNLGVSGDQLRQNGTDQVADYLNQNGSPYQWKGGGTKAADWIGFGDQGRDVLGAGGNNMQWLDDPAQGQPGYQDPAAPNDIFSGYQQFAQTGGLSPSDIRDLRSRNNSTIRSIYSSGKDDLARNKALSGGYMPNFGAANNQLARQESNQIGDMNAKSNADIVNMMLSGKQFGLTGIQNLTDLFGRQVLGSNQQGIDIQNLQNQLAELFTNAQLGRAKLPDRWDTAKKIAGIGGDVGSAIGPWT